MTTERSHSPLRRLYLFWLRFRQNRPAVGGLLFIIFAILVAFFAPVLARTDPFQFDFTSILVGPVQGHPFGTDQYGRDVYSRTIWGTRASLMVGFSAAAVAGLVGVTLGSVAGYKGGRTESLVMRAVDVMLTLPTFFLILIITLFFGASILNVVLFIGLTAWPSIARLMRAEFLSFKEREFVIAARAVGMADLRIIFSEILPNAIFPAVVNITLLISGAIIIEASLSFLGVSDPNVVSWGLMLQESMSTFRSGLWTTLFPGAAITSTVVAFNLVGDGLNDALNPILKER
ncbi:MAG TPA: ABC transporter permease [Candidatus Bathyarchaeia archaeon]|nr:ABC transporter permease [Candidatus Bathyarchaeia archaeon]